MHKLVHCSHSPSGGNGDELTIVVHIEDVAEVGTGGHPADKRADAVVLHGLMVKKRMLGLESLVFGAPRASTFYLSLVNVSLRIASPPGGNPGMESCDGVRHRIPTRGLVGTSPLSRGMLRRTTVRR